MDMCIEWDQTLRLKVTVKGFVPQISPEGHRAHTYIFLYIILYPRVALGL